MSSPSDVVIVGYARTAIGALGGVLSSVAAPKLGSVVIREALVRAGLSADQGFAQVDECVMGSVLTGGQGQAPARQAMRAAGLSDATRAVTVNKVCGSGAKAVTLAVQAIRAGDASLVVAGGMESMSLAPYALDKARAGYRMGNATLLDLLMHDGLTDPYSGGAMGVFSDRFAKENGISREAQDEYAIQSFRRANAALAAGLFADEVVAVKVASKKGEESITVDEGAAKVNYDRVPTLKPVFAKDGTVTAANASQISDGAAALVLASRARAEALGLKPLARVVAYGEFAQAPELFLSAPVGAIRSALGKAGWGVGEVDRWEINEAFATVPLAAQRALEIDGAKLNPDGGAIALGHPIGASGARILVTLLAGLKRSGGKRGVASLCIGGGEGIAVAVERE